MTTRKQFTTSSQIMSRVRFKVNNVPTHRTHTQVITKSDEITITHSVSKTVESTLAQVSFLMTNVAATRSWATTSSPGNDTQPENSQPAGDTRHQRQHVRHDHSRRRWARTSKHVQQQFSCQQQGTLRNTNKVGSGTTELLETTFQNGPAIENSQPEIRKSITVHRVTLEQLTRVYVLVIKLERIS